MIERGWGGRIVRKKRGEEGRRWTETKPLGEGGRESTPSRPKDEKEKEQQEEGNKNLSFVTSHFLFTQIQTKKLLFAGLRTPVQNRTR